MKHFYINSLTLCILLLIILLPFTLKAENETGTVTDFDGNVYKTVKIGNQVWMAENLRATHYYDGSPITYSAAVKTASADDYLAYYKYHNNDSKMVATCGLLYSWSVFSDELSTTQKSLLPSGWCVPDTADWAILANHMGGTTIAGGTLKSYDTLWTTPNVGVSAVSVFNALPAGDCNTGGFTVFRSEARFWTPQLVMAGGSGRIYMLLRNSSAALSKGQYRNVNTLSLRCIYKGTSAIQTPEATQMLRFNYLANSQNVQISGLTAASRITITSLSGKAILTKHISGISSAEVDVQGIPAGLYLVSVDGSKINQKFKFVK